jgi:ketosteroid isomerase-like protein
VKRRTRCRATVPEHWFTDHVDGTAVIVSGDIALLISDWTLTGKAADGSDVNMSGTTADVARRGPDGWKYVIDNPFGTV